MISYAQNFEDVMLERVFRDVQNGFYIDVGAADPANLSVTKWFYDKGWSGINIEPVREFYEKLVLERPRDINLNCGAGALHGEANFREDTVKEWSTFALETKSAEGAAAQDIRHQIVPIRTLNEIIEQRAAGVDIHFLNIDVEGWEENVLAGIDLQKYRPTVILVEAVERDSTEDISASIERLLSKANYLSVYFDGLNRFYIKGECESLRRCFASPPNVFDDFKLYREIEQDKVVEILRSEIAHVRAYHDRAQAELAAIRMQPIRYLSKFTYKNVLRAAARLFGKT